VIPKIPEDVMTLVPQSESGNTAVKSLDDRRVYEILPGDAGAAGLGSGETRITDFEGRVVVRAGRSLKITGSSAARVIVRWRFGVVGKVTVNGAPVTVQAGADGPYVEFDHAAESLVEWE
jgi:alpha-D-xyloside xylohydrolase